MILDWFGLHGRQEEGMKKCWWWSMQSKRREISEWRQSMTEHVNVALASLCILTESFSWRYIIGEWWAVACEYRLINRRIAGAMNLLTRYINFGPVRAKGARMSLRSALPHCQVSISEKDYQEVQIMMNTNIDGSRCWMDNALKWGSTEHQLFVVL